MQLSHTGSEEMLGKIKKSWGKLREVMGQFLHLIQEDAIGFNCLRSRFHISRLFYWSTEHCGLTILVDHFKFY